MKLASHTTQSHGVSIISGVSRRALVCSSTVTRGSIRSFQASWLVPGIDREHPRRAARQQHVGEPAGRAADVHRDRAGGIEREVVERMRQLDAPARDPRMIAPAHFERGIGRDRLARLGELRLA